MSFLHFIFLFIHLFLIHMLYYFIMLGLHHHLNLLQVLLVTTSLCIYVLPIAPIKKEIM